MIKNILIGLFVIGMLYLLFRKQNEKMTDYNLDNVESKCNLIGENLIVEKCLVNSKGKYMDDFLKCLKIHNVSQKIIDNFSPLYYAILVDNMDCVQLVNNIEKAKQ
jgi:hypothetical protein